MEKKKLAKVCNAIPRSVVPLAMLAFFVLFFSVTFSFFLARLQGVQKKVAEFCWSQKILTKIDCCGAKFPYEPDLGALDPA